MTDKNPVGRPDWLHETRKVTELKEWPKNPRRITEQGLNKLKDSLSKFGVAEPIVINQDNVICGGHGRLKALKQLGIKEVPVYVTTLDDKQFEELNIRLNKNIAGEWDFDILANEFEQHELLDWGFEPEEFGIKDVLNEGLTDEDAVPEAPVEPVTKLGDIWLLGNHRLMCGDSTSIDAVEKLMAGAKADMVFTDPPYGVNYDGGHATDKRRVKLQNDDKVDMYDLPIKNAYLVTTDAAPMYLWFADRFANDVINGVEGAGFSIRSWIIWNKNLAQFGAIGAQYKSKHEPCIYAYKTGKKANWCGANNEVTVWDIKRESKNAFHPTQKPVEICERAMLNHSCGSVIDLFGGSGATLIAAEKNNKKAFLMELDPKYCDVIIKRWQEYTGLEATLESDGNTYNSLIPNANKNAA